MKTKQKFSRLPTCVRPKKYDISYDLIDLDHHRFEGKEKIHLLIVERTSVITCHAVDLWIRNVQLVYDENEKEKSISASEIQYIEADQAVRFCFSQELPSSVEAVLTLEFHGILNDQLRGFYRSEYEVNGQNRTMAVTQYEACDARRAFVCWDEPAIKAKYQILMVTAPHLTAISNTSLLSTRIQKSKYGHNLEERVWVFKETPVMSTYLVGMVVGEFDFIADYTKDGTRVAVYTPLGKSHLGTFALSVATKALNFFAEKFKIPYPLQKLDMLAIPDFAAGAMENWGCITYRETRLLIDDEKSSIAQKTAVARTVSHELAHQWFGNLVTMKWWTSLWLKEGFARFMEFEAVNHIFPEWNVWEKFVQEIVMDTAMEKDAMLTSHPIEVEVGHPDEVDEIFDVISYAKGASIIRMLMEYLGSTVFYEGIQHYLKKFSYGNAGALDLWSSLKLISGYDIEKMMKMWTHQTGYPVISLMETRDTNQLRLIQERFLLNPEISDPTCENVWDIPLTLTTSEDSTRMHFLGVWTCNENAYAPHECQDKDLQTILSRSLPQGGDSWIILNVHQTGFYLVNYTPSQWTQLEAPVSNLVLGTVDRMSLLKTAFNLARSGRLDIRIALNFSRAYRMEPEFLCWQELSSNLMFYRSLIETEACYSRFQEYIRFLYHDISHLLTWERKKNDNEIAGLFRRTILSVLGSVDDPKTIQEACHRFEQYVTAGSTRGQLSPDLRGVIFSIQAMHGDQIIHDQLKNIYITSDFVEEKVDALAAIGKVPSESLKVDTLQWALKHVRAQDISYPFSSVANNRAGAQIAWNFIQENWIDLNQKYSPAIVGRIVASSISRFNSIEKANEVENFLESRRHHAYDRLLNGTLERIRTEDTCYQRDHERIAQWLHDQNQRRHIGNNVE